MTFLSGKCPTVCFWGPLSFKLRRRRAWYLLNSRVSPSWPPFRCTSVLSLQEAPIFGHPTGVKKKLFELFFWLRMRIWPQNHEAFWVKVIFCWISSRFPGGIVRRCSSKKACSMPRDLRDPKIDDIHVESPMIFTILDPYLWNIVKQVFGIPWTVLRICLASWVFLVATRNWLLWGNASFLQANCFLVFTCCTNCFPVHHRSSTIIEFLPVAEALLGFRGDCRRGWFWGSHPVRLNLHFRPWKVMVGRKFMSFSGWNGLFSEAKLLLVSGSVPLIFSMGRVKKKDRRTQTQDISLHCAFNVFTTKKPPLK